MVETAQNTARHYIACDLRDSIEHVDDVARLLPHASLDEPDELVEQLAAAREALVAAQAALEEAVHA